MPFVTINGINYHYSAKTPHSTEPDQAVVFIHGAGGSSEHWAHQVAHLGRRYLAMAVDLPGHGQSGGTPRDSIEAYREFINEFAERLLGFPFYLAGHSMGGAIAMDFALNYPGRLAGLVLLGTGARLRVLPAMLEAFRTGNVPGNMAGFLYRPGTPETILKGADEEIKSTDPSVFYADFVACDKFDVTGRIEEITIPTLVATGDKDVMTPVKYGNYIASRINNACFEVVGDAGHMPMLEQPAQVNSLVERFMAGNAGTGSTEAV